MNLTPKPKGLRVRITTEEWNLLYTICERAKMYWFYAEFHDRKTVTRQCLEDSTSSFLAENMDALTDQQLLRLYEFYARYNLVDDFMRSELLKYMGRKPTTKED